MDNFSTVIEKIGTSSHLPLQETAQDEGHEWPFVSIILPTWREEKYIGACLHSILSQDYPQQRMEILVVDGMSTDETRTIVRHYASEFPQVKLLDNPDRLQAPGLNRGILHSQGTIIIRMDAHAEYERTYVRSCVTTLKTTRSDNVGGPQRLRARTFFQRALSCALGSPLGTGGASYRHAGRDGYVDTVFLGAFRRETFRRVGLFDPGAITNEDAELNQRIIASGGRVYLSSNIECYYYPRDGFRSLGVQYFRYGRGRARTVLKHRNILRASSFAPFLFFTAALGLMALGALFTPALWAGAGMLATYLAALVGESARLAARSTSAYFALLPLIFMTFHASHACGVAWGLLFYTFNPDWEKAPPPKLAD